MTSMFQGKSVQVKPLEDDFIELCFDREGSPINKLDQGTMRELGEALKSLHSIPRIRGLLITSDKDAFIVGADIGEFIELFSSERRKLLAVFQQSNDVLCDLEDLPFPTVAALKGFVLGGGFEVALAADLRVIADSATVGFPEVTLGILPGFGGTVRAARVVSLPVACEWIMSGVRLSATEAARAGAADLVTGPADLRDRAIGLLKDAADAKVDWRAARRKKLTSADCNAEWRALLPSLLERAAAQSAKHLPAAAIAIQSMARSAAVPRDLALRIETSAIVEAARTQAAGSLIQLFLNDQVVKKKIRSQSKGARPVHHTAIVGAGVMGRGIATCIASLGTPVVLTDVGPARLDAAIGEVARCLNRRVSQDQLTQGMADQMLASVRTQITHDGFAELDLVVEAIDEEHDRKCNLLRQIEEVIPDNAIIASNTSSLRISDLAKALSRPARFVGLHFFNPAATMPLVEVVRGDDTSDLTVATAMAYVAGLKKTPVLVRDGPGFLVNRVLTAYMLAFIQLLEEGGSFVEIDCAMEQFGWPMGPAYLNDVIGLDVGSRVFSNIADAMPDYLIRRNGDALHAMIAADRLGRKTGAGFYRHVRATSSMKSRTPDKEAFAAIRAIQTRPRSIARDEIVERMMLALMAASVRCLDAGVVDTAAELDMALVLGLGFPKHLGGPLKYADWIGPPRILEWSRRYEGLGPLYALPQRLRNMAASGHKFY